MTSQIATDLTIMDGGMGSELLKRSGQRGGLWSAQALLDAPETVAQVHQDYIDAGARLIITNTYSTVPSYLQKGGWQDRFLELATLAGQIARDVADQGPDHVRVAGSLPPLNESYRFDLVPPAQEAASVYTALAQALMPYVDLFICETMSSVREARNAVAAARRVGGADTPVWVSWTLAEEPGRGLRSGESISQAVAELADYGVEAYLFNCTSADAITAGLAELRTLTTRQIGAYPNLLHIPAGWTLDNEVQAGHYEMTDEEFRAYAVIWREQGAQIIGGCCGIGPQHIRALATL